MLKEGAWADLCDTESTFSLALVTARFSFQAKPPHPHGAAHLLLLVWP